MNKRRCSIDRLLEREEFADYWAMKWCDLLRVKAEFPINLWPNAAQAYHHRWIRDRSAPTSLMTNLPANCSRPAAATSVDAPVNFYRAMQNREPGRHRPNRRLISWGARADKWLAEQRAGMAVFFSKVGAKATGEWKEEIIFFDPERPTPLRSRPFFRMAKSPRFLLRDPRAVFADWLIPRIHGSPRNIANRVWAGFWGAASFTNRTTCGRTIRRAIRSCSLIWKRNLSPPITISKVVPAHSQFPDLQARVRAAKRQA